MQLPALLRWLDGRVKVSDPTYCDSILAVPVHAADVVGGPSNRSEVANLFNHPNFAPPSVLTVGGAGFGTLTALQQAKGAGPRQIQLTARITF